MGPVNNTVAARKGLPCYHLRGSASRTPPCYRSPTSSTPFTVTLMGVSPSVIIFADRPVRSAGHALTAHFLEEWDPATGADSFAKDPPNATVSAFDKEASTVKDAVVELTAPNRFLPGPPNCRSSQPALPGTSVPRPTKVSSASAMTTPREGPLAVQSALHYCSAQGTSAACKRSEPTVFRLIGIGAPGLGRCLRAT